MAQAPIPLLEILAFTGNSTTRYPLPRSGRVTIGREERNDIHLDDPAISRFHALLHVGPPLRIEDAGSSNGIRLVRQDDVSSGTARLHESRLAPRESKVLEVGEGMILGGTLLVVQLREEASPASSRRPRSGVTVVVRDPAMRRLHETVDRIAEAQLSVLLLGETGVGKDVLAEAIHYRSHRARQPMLCLNCAAFSEALLESELFGHEAGAFTGAGRAKPGLLELGDGGTVFLDEVGELPPSIQVKLLRVLEDRKVLRVGGLRARSVDVRFISATNRNLASEARRGTFRQDLYFRLNGISLTIPPLRERVVEIEHLARSFITQVCAQLRRSREPFLSEDAIAMLERYPWPGNIRELRNVIERTIMLCSGETIMPAHLQLDQVPASARQSQERVDTLRPGHSKEVPEQDRTRILEALDRCAGNQTRAAKLLGISRRTLVNRLEEYRIARPRK